MKRFGFFLLSPSLAVAVAGCAGMQLQSGGSATPVTGTRILPPAAARQATPSIARYTPLSVHSDRRPSYMQPDADKKAALLYVGDWATNDVDVYDYANGTSVGTLTGFSEPYGECADAKGDIYITNFGAGTAVEYAHGGKSPINTYSGAGEPIGCAVDAKGDVAVTSFSPAEVTVFAGGDPSKATTYTGPCAYLWTMGYDDQENLVGIGEESTGSIVACALLSGSKSMTTLSGCCSASDPIVIDFPGGSTWDGKYLALGDQEAGGTFRTSLIRATVTRTTLRPHGETVLSCSSGYAGVVNPFIVGEKNTPVNRRQGRVVVGATTFCDASGVDYWHYPGGNPFFGLPSPPSQPYGAGVSLKN